MSRDAIILINKPSGFTSFETISKVKRIMGIKKIGHTGTLDKFAEGLMVVLIGRYTRLASFVTGLSKEYIAEIQLGCTTDTLDPEGLVVENGEIPNRQTLEKVFDQFSGTIDQVPPIYSAIHVQGKRAYKMARNGETPEIAPRKVIIHCLELLSYQPPYLDIKVSCSKGTYIRSLARDIAKAADSCGYVTRLKRTKVGNFCLENAFELEQLKDIKNFTSPWELLHSLENISGLTIKEEMEKVFLNGGLLNDSAFKEEIPEEGTFFVFNTDKRLIGVIQKIKDQYKYMVVLS